MHAIRSIVSAFLPLTLFQQPLDMPASIMRLATITNWAYGLTVALTLASGTTMLLASRAQEIERDAVDQRHRLDQVTSRLEEEILLLTGQARSYVISGDPSHLTVYRRETGRFQAISARLKHIRAAGASIDELQALEQAVHWADNLRAEQGEALKAKQEGDLATATAILFGPEYASEISRIEAEIERFQYRLDQRTSNEVHAAEASARLWKLISEIALGATGTLFLCVLFFVFRQRVLRPVVRLSDVVTRLAAQDYEAELPDIDQIDEIGDMAQAMRIFRENGIARQKLEHERQAERTLRDLLARMTQRMQGCESLADLREVVQTFVPEIAPTLAGRLYLLESGRNALVEMSSWGSPRRSHSDFPPLDCWAVRRGAPHRPAGPMIDIRCDHIGLAEEAGADSWCLPLTAQREIIGLLYLECIAERPCNGVPENMLQMLTENIALSVANLQLRDRLHEMATVDALTGLSNRRELDTALLKHSEAAERAGAPLACLMVDVDHFKRFNDRFGHDAGDAVLTAVGRVLRAMTRENGLAFRYGGEEFSLLIPGVGTELARERAEAIRLHIEKLSIVHEGEDLGRITVSVGVAAYPDHGSSASLLQTADAALLRAKSSGRNRVEVATIRGARKLA